VSGNAAVALEITDLRTRIERGGRVVHAVDGVSLRIEAGQTLGCGKSMTAMSVLRLLPPGGRIAGGAIRVNGQDVVAMDDRQLRALRGSQVAMVFQDPMTSLNPTMTIGRQIAEAVRTHRSGSWKQAMARAEEMLGLVGMPTPRDRLGDYPHQLSGGLRQRVVVAMALACEPTLLIADEPTTALDVTVQAQILRLLDRLKAELNMAMLLITHDLGVIAGHADDVAVMYAGQVVEQAPTVELFADMHHPYTEALLASIPMVDHDPDEPLYSIPGLPPDLIHPPTGCRFAARCRYATDECRTVQPDMAGSGAHRFACFHPVGSPVAPSSPVAAASGSRS